MTIHTIGTYELRELADDLVNYTMTDAGELEDYIVFLWQELERLDPERWQAVFRVEYADLVERMGDA
jgi:hypothetical protein